MADVAGGLTFTFDADFSGFTRAAEGAGSTLDTLTRAAAAWAGGTSAAMTSALGTAGRPLDLTSGLSRAPAADGDQATRALATLSQQLALLQSTGAAHQAIAAQMKVEAAQAKLGTDATEAQKASAAALVGQIEAATAAQKALRSAQDASNAAWRFGSDALADGVEAIVLQGATLKSVAASIVSSFARQGLSAALTGSGAFAGLFGTAGANGATGGLFGALGSLLTGGGASSVATSFSGLYANGGSIDAGKWGVVGERGAEVVAGPATVVPWSRIAGQAQATSRATQVIQFNVSTPDAPSFARSEAQMAALVSRAVARGQRNS